MSGSPAPRAMHPPLCRDGGKGRPTLPAALAAVLLAATLLAALCLPAPAALATLPGTDSVSLSWSTYNRVYYGNYNTPVFTVTDSAGYPTFAYCVDPTTPPPAAGTWGTQTLEQVVGGNAGLVRAALWFGYGGPGFDASMWPSTWEDGSSMGAGAYYCATHLILSYLSSQRPGYAYYNAGADFIAYASHSFMGIDLAGNVVNPGSTMFQMAQRAAEVPDDYTCYFLTCGSWDNVQHMLAQDYYAQTGSLEVVKASSNPAVSSGNPLYSLSGATYGVYAGGPRSQDPESLGPCVATVVLDENGRGTAAGLDPGFYQVVEQAAPSGYALDQTVHTIEVAPGMTALLQVADNPLAMPAATIAYKGDAADPSAAPLAGAEFTVSFYAGDYGADTLPDTPDRRWVLASDAQGIASLDQGHLVSGDEFYLDGQGQPVLPCGTLTVQETKAPQGYGLSDDALYIRKIAPAADGTLPASLEPVNVADYPLGGTIEVLKVDADTLMPQPQGDATLAGAEFSVTVLSEQPVLVDGRLYGQGEVVATMTTDENGRASTGDTLLPPGRYRIEETKAPQGYLPSAVAWDVRSDASGVELEGPQVAAFVEDGVLVIPNAVVRGSAGVQKNDRDTGVGSPLGQATLSGAAYEIVNASVSPVVVDGTQYQSGEAVATIVTSQDGSALIEDASLPYGTYELRETQAPQGYTPDPQDVQTCQVRTQGGIATPERPFSDRVVRGDAMLAKVETGTGAAMPGVAFKVTSLTTGEWHVLVADSHGYINTSSGVVAHSRNTNTNDLALDAEGNVVDESALSWENGVWFSGSADTPTQVIDELGALPYDRYRFEELATSASFGHRLVSFDIAIRENGAMVDLGFVNDDVISIRTTALGASSGTHEEQPSAAARIVDTVALSGLEPGRSYRLSGMLMDVRTGRPVLDGRGAPVTSVADFVANASEQTIEMPFLLDASGLAGHETVVFENLFLDGVLVATHADLADPDQTVRWTEEALPEVPKTADPTDPTVPLSLAAAAALATVAGALSLVLNRRNA